MFDPSKSSKIFTILLLHSTIACTQHLLERVFQIYHDQWYDSLWRSGGWCIFLHHLSPRGFECKRSRWFAVLKQILDNIKPKRNKHCVCWMSVHPALQTSKAVRQNRNKWLRLISSTRPWAKLSEDNLKCSADHTHTVLHKPGCNPHAGTCF